MSHVQSFINTGIANTQCVNMDSRFLNFRRNDKGPPMMHNKQPGFDEIQTMLTQSTFMDDLLKLPRM